MADNERELPGGVSEEDGPDLIVLEDDEGHELTFEVLAALDYNGEHYVGVVEYVEDESQLQDDLELVILRVGEDEEGEFYDIVEDDEEFFAVGAEMEKLLSDEFDVE